jgi:hypothetical protein
MVPQSDEVVQDIDTGRAEIDRKPEESLCPEKYPILTYAQTKWCTGQEPVVSVGNKSEIYDFCVRFEELATAGKQQATGPDVEYLNRVSRSNIPEPDCLVVGCRCEELAIG